MAPLDRKLKSVRLHSVDALHGLAIIAVVLLHINIRFHFEKAGFGGLIPMDVMRVVFWAERIP